MVATPLEGLTGIILAGGKSTRMGRDKAFLPWPERPLIQELVEKLEGMTREVMVVTKEVGKFRFLEVPVYADAVEACSPLAGIYTGLLHSSTELNLVVACDLPFISPEVVHRLYDAMEGYEAAIPESAHGLEPLFGIYRKSCSEILKKSIEENRLSVNEVLGKLRRNVLPQTGWSERELFSFLNANTWREYQQARQVAWERGEGIQDGLR